MANKKNQPNDEESKVTSEKPVSLNPLNLKQALEGLLQVKPKPKEKPKRKRKQREEKTHDKAK
jgi:hypothetical protein